MRSVAAPRHVSVGCHGETASIVMPQHPSDSGPELVPFSSPATVVITGHMTFGHEFILVITNKINITKILFNNFLNIKST